jgi:hypothetical protein
MFADLQASEQRCRIFNAPAVLIPLIDVLYASLEYQETSLIRSQDRVQHEELTEEKLSRLDREEGGDSA